MGSLMSMVLETMAGEGAVNAAEAVAFTFGSSSATVSQLAQFLRCVEGNEVDALTPNPSSDECDAAFADDEKARSMPIWSYKSASLTEVNSIECLVRDEHYKGFGVLQRVKFGAPKVGKDASLDGSDIVPSVFVKRFHSSAPFELPLTEDYRVATFRCTGGSGKKGPLWPLVAMYDESFFHVFVYESSDLGNDAPQSLKGATDPITKEEFRKFKEACARLMPEGAGPDESIDTLKQDQLFNPLATQEAPAFWDVPAQAEATLQSLTPTPVRIVVIVAFTACKERDDYSPGHIGCAARLYPHVMVQSTVDLAGIVAGVQLERAPKTTGGCSCHAMKEEMCSLLITDADKDTAQNTITDLGNVTARVFSLPDPVVTYWNSLFNYYHPIDDSSSVMLNRLIQVVRAEGKAKLESHPDVVTRKGELNKSALKRVRHQGAFDNIHMAPRMRLPATWVWATNPTFKKQMDDADRERLRVDNIAMAPFCVHDCFHMHWRWTDLSDSSQFGFNPDPSGPYAPGVVAGATMVPPNQDVYLYLYAVAGLNYCAAAHDARAGEWQVFCHHGAAYAVHYTRGFFRDAGRTNRTDMITSGDESGSTVFYFEDDPMTGCASLTNKGDWADFYWRLRWYYPSWADASVDSPVERVIVNDWEYILKF